MGFYRAIGYFMPDSPNRDRQKLDNYILAGVRKYGLHAFETAVAEWYRKQGDLEEHYGNLESAAGDYLKAATLQNAHFSFKGAEDRLSAMNVSMSLASIMLRQRRHAEAKSFFRMAFELRPEDPQVQDAVGENIIRHGTSAEIREYFEAVLRVDPASRMARFALEVQRRFPKMVDALCEAHASQRRAGGGRAGIIVMPLWGESYLRIFCDYALHILLASGNLPKLAEFYGDLRFEIFTTAAGRRKLVANSRFRALRELLPIRFTIYPKPLMDFADHHVGRFQLLQLSHYATLECARRTDADVVFVFPDNIVNDGFYGALGKRMADPSLKAVACSGFRLHVDDILPVIDREYRAKDGTISLPAREIVRLLMDHLDDAWFVDSKRFAVSPFFLCWRLGKEGLLVRATHFQPYAIRARYLKGPLSPSIDPVDAQFMYRNFDNLEGIDLVQDTEMCVLDAGMAPNLDPHAIQGSRYFDEVAFARFLHTYDTPLHRKYLKAPVRLALAKTSRRWERVERDSEHMIKRVFDLIDGFDRMAPTRCDWARPAAEALRPPAPGLNMINAELAKEGAK